MVHPLETPHFLERFALQPLPVGPHKGPPPPSVRLPGALKQRGASPQCPFRPPVGAPEPSSLLRLGAESSGTGRQGQPEELLHWATEAAGDHLDIHKTQDSAWRWVAALKGVRLRPSWTGVASRAPPQETCRGTGISVQAIPPPPPEAQDSWGWQQKLP